MYIGIILTPSVWVNNIPDKVNATVPIRKSRYIRHRSIRHKYHYCNTRHRKTTRHRSITQKYYCNTDTEVSHRSIHCNTDTEVLHRSSTVILDRSITVILDTERQRSITLNTEVLHRSITERCVVFVVCSICVYYRSNTTLLQK